VKVRTVLGLDPGTSQSAFVEFDGEKLVAFGTKPNKEIASWFEEPVVYGGPFTEKPVLVIERIESYGMAVGVETFETVFWSGRFAQAWGDPWDRIGRRDIKQHLCFSARATDANIRQALYDRFGPGKEKAVGVKKAPGPLFGLKGHEYAALAVAVTYWDRRQAASVATSVGF
jgi:hypothetical protein